jgi:hypothetical protein
MSFNFWLCSSVLLPPLPPLSLPSTLSSHPLPFHHLCCTSIVPSLYTSGADTQASVRLYMPPTTEEMKEVSDSHRLAWATRYTGLHSYFLLLLLPPPPPPSLTSSSIFTLTHIRSRIYTLIIANLFNHVRPNSISIFLLLLLCSVLTDCLSFCLTVTHSFSLFTGWVGGSPLYSTSRVIYCPFCCTPGMGCFTIERRRTLCMHLVCPLPSTFLSSSSSSPFFFSDTNSHFQNITLQQQEIMNTTSNSQTKQPCSPLYSCTHRYRMRPMFNAKSQVSSANSKVRPSFFSFFFLLSFFFVFVYSRRVKKPPNTGLTFTTLTHATISPAEYISLIGHHVPSSFFFVHSSSDPIS